MKEDGVSLKEYIISLIDGVKESVNVAREAMDKRLNGMNEFRDTLKDQASRFVTRDEVNTKIDNMASQLEELKLNKAMLEGKASQSSATTALIFGIVGVILSVVGLVMSFFD